MDMYALTGKPLTDFTVCIMRPLLLTSSPTSLPLRVLSPKGEEIGIFIVWEEG
jgi:hypothetical protein